MKWLLVLLLVPSLFCAGLFAISNFSDGSIEIESLESKTNDGAPVYNRIWRSVRGPFDIWMMQQSHQGPNLAHNLWDRLAIVVDRNNQTARFYQLEPGELVWSEKSKDVPFKVACFLCHANGPRAIRPNFASLDAPLSWKNSARIFTWNLRIKTYGRILPDPVHLPAGTRFRAEGTFANERLPARTCALCHNNHWWGRGELLRQHFMPIRFMLKNGNMPPPGIPLSMDEHKAIDDFLRDL